MEMKIKDICVQVKDRISSDEVSFACYVTTDCILQNKAGRTTATEAINRGMPIEQVQRLLGHAKIDTRMRYVQVDQQNVTNEPQKVFGVKNGIV